MTHTLKKSLLAIAALALLGGCATSAFAPKTSAQTTHIAESALTSYQGRFAVRYIGTNGQAQNIYGHFVWRENDETVTLQLFNPLGQMLAMLEAAPANATLRLPNRAPRIAANVEDLMRDVLGFALPINHLRTWLRPLAHTGIQPTNRTHPASSHPNQLKEDGWTIEYLSATDKQSAPTQRINLSRDEPPTQVKLVIEP